MSHSISGQTDRVDRIAYTMREAAQKIPCCERTLWGRIKAGELKSVRIGRSVRILHDDLMAFLDERRS